MSTNRRSLLRAGAGSVAVKLSNRVVLVLTTMVLARACGADGFGVYAYLFAIVQILGIFAQMGFHVLAVREVAACVAGGQWGLLRGLLARMDQLLIAASLTTIGLALLGAWLLVDRLERQELGTLWWGLVLLPLIAFGNVRGATLRGLHGVVTGQLPEFVIRPTVFLVLGLVAWASVTPEDLSPVTAMKMHVIAGLVAVVFAGLQLRRALPQQVGSAQPSYRTREWAHSAVILSLVSSIQVINGQTDLIMLGALAGPAEVGIYRVAVQGGLVVALGLQVVNMVVAPHFARMHAEGDRDGIQRLASSSARQAFAFALLVAILFALRGRELLGIVFGAEFASGHGALLVLTVGQVVNAFMGSVVVLLGMANQEGSLLKGLCASAGVNVLLNAALIPVLGMLGAAIATTSTLVLWNVVLAIVTYRRLRIVTWAIGAPWDLGARTRT